MLKTLAIGEDVVFLLEYRELGPSVHLLVRLPAQPPMRETRQFVQVWRADCFKDRPHEHLFKTDGEVQVFLEDMEEDLARSAASSGRSVDWCAVQLRELQSVLDRAGYPEVRINQAEADEVLWKVTSWCEAASKHQFYDAW